MKISIIGSSGSVGLEITKLLLLNKEINNLKLNLFYHTEEGRKKIIGMTQDMIIGNKVYDINITSSINDLINTDICILCAGKAIDTNIKKITNNIIKYENNRDMLYEENKKIILYWTEQIKKYCPSSLIILVTNPVSKLLMEIYNNYPNIKAVGCGVTNDTLRVRNELIKDYNSKLLSNLFIIGEHNLGTQTIALSHFNNISKQKIERKLFEKEFTNKEEKKLYIKEIKEKQNKFLEKNELEEILKYNQSLPIIYKSYMTHRMSHFLFKTHLSTAIAINEVIEAYIFENKTISVEVKCNKYLSYNNCILGVPIEFKNREIILKEINLTKEEEKILLECANKYKLMEEK